MTYLSEKMTALSIFTGKLDIYIPLHLKGALMQI